MTTAGAGAVRPNAPRIVLGLVPALGNSFWNVIINAIEEVVLRAGCGVVFGDTRHDPVREGHYEQLAQAGWVAGLMLFNASSSFAPRLLGHGVPATIVYSNMPESDAIPAFGIANREGAMEMVRYMAGLGHRRIAHLAGPDQNLDSRERLRGYMDGLAAAGLPFDPDLVWPGSYSFVAGTRAAQRYFALAERPSAVFAASDELAIGLIAGLREGGASVPGTVSVAGFDGVDISAMYAPALTTMLQPRAELGRLAAECLVRQLDGEAVRGGTVRLPCRLVVRQSVAPPAGHVPA